VILHHCSVLIVCVICCTMCVINKLMNEQDRRYIHFYPLYFLFLTLILLVFIAINVRLMFRGIGKRGHLPPVEML